MVKIELDEVFDALAEGKITWPTNKQDCLTTLHQQIVILNYIYIN
jgi:hypothetical protein